MSISKRFTIWILSVLLVIVTVSSYLYYRFEMDEETERLESFGDTLGTIIEHSLEDFMMTRDFTVLDKTLNDLKNIEPINRIWLINREGVIKGGTDRNEIGMKLSQTDERCQGCHEKRQKIVILTGEKIFRWAQPIKNKSKCYKCHDTLIKHNGILLIDFSLVKSEQHVKKDILRGSLIFFLSLITLGFVISILSKTLVIKRLDNMINVLRGFKKGDYNIRAPIEGDNEITELSKSFNEMAEAINLRDETLKKERDLSRGLIESLPGIFYMFNAKGKMLQWNKNVEEVTGYSAEEIAKFSPFDLIAERDREIVAEKIKEAFTEGNASVEANILLKNGKNIPYFLTGVRGEIENESYIVGVGIDITERRQAEEEREELILGLQNAFTKVSHSQKEWQETFDSITDLVSIHDKDFNIIRANRAFAKYFGVTPQEVINKKCYDVFHKTGLIVRNCPHKKTLEEKRAVTDEILDPKTNKIFEVSTFPYYSPEREFIGSIHIAKDITEEKEKEMRLIMSERLASLGQMASGIAHEINNPLASIAGCAEGLLNRIKKGQFEPELFENYLKIIEEEILRCKGITTSMLSFVRKTTYKKKEININETLDKTLEVIGFQGRLQQIEVIKNYKDGMPVILGSEGELKQVFLSIIINALDAMEDRGTLTIETGIGKDIEFIKISDIGSGISHENISRIFTPFFTTKSEKGGTGLGLSIANRIVMNHNGNIAVQTEEGKGTTFKIILPI